MNNDRQLLAPVAPETWIHRFVDGAAGTDVAFVTPSGHVLTWAQYRFVYPRYREVDAEWQPPTHSLEALVLHFGAYEVVIPAAQLDLELNDLSNYAYVYHRLTRAWDTAPREQSRPVPMNERIQIERIAAVHSKLDFALAGYLSHRTSLQHILSVPGVRIERSRSALSEVSHALQNEAPTTEAIARASDEIRMNRLDGHALDRPRRYLAMSLRDYPRLRALYDAIWHEYPNDYAVLTGRMFIEAVRGDYSNRDQLLLCRILLNSARAERLDPAAIVKYAWMMVSLAEGLQQYRTAWCIAMRAFALQARVTWWSQERRRESLRVRLVDSESLRMMSDLAHRANHPYWTTVFTLWQSDFAGMVRTTDHAVLSLEEQSPKADEAARAETLWDIARPSWSLQPDER